MSVQFFELIFFALVAFLIISKLISILGTTNQEDATKFKSYFGERGFVKDVTNNIKSNDNDVINTRELKTSYQNLDNFITFNNKEEIVKSLDNLQIKLPSFTVEKFIKSAKSAVGLILESLAANDDQALSNLVDKRYLEQIKLLAKNYEKIINPQNLEAKISNIYMFGNNVFVKLLLVGSDELSNQSFEEEWTFTKSLIIKGPNWHLTNIETTS